jgi:hypothetical protein
MVKLELQQVLSKANRQEYRKFGLTLGIVFSLIGISLYWKSKGSAPYFLGIGFGFILSGLIFPSILKYIYTIWMGFAVIMGFFMSRLILSVIFFLIFAPVGIITRLLNKDLLKERWDRNAESYWIRREKKPYDPKSAENQY